MIKNLMIVESPAKAKTIEKFLGKDFTVASSYGHIRDLPKGDTAIDIKNGFSPTYVVPEDKTKVVKELQKLASESEQVWLATDEDREGEAISWHLCSVLNLPVEDVNRIVFHEITKSAIENAVKHPRKINMDLVNAQQARRILDRLVGFELSPILWKRINIKSRLSAGRVQSVAVKLVVEREQEISDFTSESYFKVSAYFNLEGGAVLKAELKDKIRKEQEVRQFLEKCAEAEFSVADVVVKPGKRSPAPPFTTSTLQQEASRKLGFSVSKTMMMAQKLYESGQITYMRTDSVNLSDTAIGAAGKEIKSAFGDEYAEPRKYKTKSAGAQEAHEAIRPSYFDKHEGEGSTDEKRLYELIWKRAIASQMSQARIEKTTVNVSLSNSPELFVATGEVIKFDGFLKVYIESSDEDQEEDTSVIPPIQKGEKLDMDTIEAVERFSKPPARYNEASLVKKMEELGIGRPSTYAPTISTIQKRGYVIKESREGKSREFMNYYLKAGNINSERKTEVYGTEKAKLFPTDVGILVTDFLTDHFDRVMDYHFTAQIEAEFDEIAQGMKEWSNMIDSFYNPFHKKVETAEEEKTKITGERPLGEDPKTGKPIIARMGKYGPMVQLGESSDDEKPKYAKLLHHQNLQTIQLEDALELFKLPRIVGNYEDSEVKASIGKYGPYLHHKDKFYSLGKDADVFDVTIEEAKSIINLKRQAEASKTIKTFDENAEVKVLNGKYGPYVSHGRTNARIPKDKKPEELTLEDCLELIEEAKKNKGKRKGARKKVTK